MSACSRFRRELELVLEGRPSPDRLSVLSWNEHLLGCSECRELLESEHALETLLASLPDPRLPDALAQRVLARLRRDREGLDELLDSAPMPDVPADLARRVLAGVADAEARSDDALERLLDAVPEPVVPRDLTSIVLAGITADAQRARFRSVRRVSFAVLAVAAAILLLFLLIRKEDEHTESVQVAESEPVELTDEFLEAFEVLEHWEHVGGDDIDLLLASIDEIDELILVQSAWELEEETTEGSGG